MGIGCCTAASPLLPCSDAGMDMGMGIGIGIDMGMDMGMDMGTGMGKGGMFWRDGA